MKKQLLARAASLLLILVLLCGTAQNTAERRYVASLTKSLTALMLLESGADLNTTITIPDRLTEEFKEIQNFNGADMKLKIGENIRLADLLYGMLVPSANDAASVVADYLGAGSIDAFVQKMNERAMVCTIRATFPPPRTWRKSPPRVTRTRSSWRWRTPQAIPCPPTICIPTNACWKQRTR